MPKASPHGKHTLESDSVIIWLGLSLTLDILLGGVCCMHLNMQIMMHAQWDNITKSASIPMKICRSRLLIITHLLFFLSPQFCLFQNIESVGSFNSFLYLTVGVHLFVHHISLLGRNLFSDLNKILLCRVSLGLKAFPLVPSIMFFS